MSEKSSMPVELSVVLRSADNRVRFSRLPGPKQAEHIRWIAAAKKKDVRLRRAAHVAKKLRDLPVAPPTDDVDEVGEDGDT